MPAHVGAGVPANINKHRGLSPRSYDVALGRSNHLYSVAALTNQAGGVVERYRYDTYGQRQIVTKGADGNWGTADDGVATASAYGNQIGFTGRYLDKETGLWYFRARYYSGTLGRFIGRDTGERKKTPRAKSGYQDGYNLYTASFVPNLLDPTGRTAYPDQRHRMPFDGQTRTVCTPDVDLPIACKAKCKDGQVTASNGWEVQVSFSPMGIGVSITVTGSCSITCDGGNDPGEGILRKKATATICQSFVYHVGWIWDGWETDGPPAITCGSRTIEDTLKCCPTKSP